MIETKFKYHAKFEIGDRVIFDGHKEVIVRITAVKFSTNCYPLYCVEWINQGVLVVAWIEEWRLANA